MPYWLPFGIFTGLVAIVPFFGTLLSTTLPALFVLTAKGYHGFTPLGHALLVVGLGVVVLWRVADDAQRASTDTALS